MVMEYHIHACAALLSLLVALTGRREYGQSLLRHLAQLGR